MATVLSAFVHLDVGMTDLSALLDFQASSASFFVTLSGFTQLIDMRDIRPHLGMFLELYARKLSMPEI
jgi:hypothetical protein